MNRRLLLFPVFVLILFILFGLVVVFYNPVKAIKIRAGHSVTKISEKEVASLVTQYLARSPSNSRVLGEQSSVEVEKVGSVKKTDFSYNAISSSWEDRSPKGVSMQIQLRTSSDGKNWSIWKPIEIDDDESDHEVPYKKFGRLVTVNGKYYQEKVIFKVTSLDNIPELKNLSLTYIDSKEKLSFIEKFLKELKLKVEKAFASSDSPTSPGEQPNICSRACWGADESIYVPGEDYSPVKKIIIHHTVTANNDPDPAATVRAIYYYHNVVRGWGDIGYNFLIDQNNGTIYEGRKGGDGVDGAHTHGYNSGSVGVAILGDFRYVGPNAKVQNALHKLIVWKLYSHHINPDEVSVFGMDGFALPAVFVHGLVANTACAGTYLNNFTPSLISMAHYLPQQIVIRNADGVRRVEGGSDTTVWNLLAAYSGQGAVAPNYIRAMLAFPSDGTTPPNDSNYSSQWDLTKLGALNVWKETVGGDPSVKVAVLDTGVAYENYDPPGSEIYAKAPDFSNTHFVGGYDFVNGDNHPNDDEGHGTVIASIIAESTNNSMGSASLAYNISIMPVKVCDRDGYCDDYAIAQGIDFARQNGAKVINMSFGGSDYSQVIQGSIDAAWNSGIVLVSSSGNKSIMAVDYPASGNHVIAAGAVTSSDTRPAYSNWGSVLDLSAPGGDALNLLTYQYVNCGQDLDCTNFGYGHFYGTSLPSALISASAALVISKGALFPDSVERYLEITARSLGSAGFDPSFGWGEIKPLDAITLINSNQQHPNGTLITSSETGKIYVLENGSKRWIVSPNIFNSRYRWQDVSIISAAELNSYPNGSNVGFSDGTLIREPSTGKVYVVSTGQKRWITGPNILLGLGYKWQNVLDVVAWEADMTPNGSNISSLSTHPDGTLVTSLSTQKIYLLDSGKKRWIPLPSIFLSRFHWENVITITDSELNTYIDGLNVNFRDGTLIQDSTKVYIVDTPNGSASQSKHWICCSLSLYNLGYKWGNINQVPDSLSASFSDSYIIY